MAKSTSAVAITNWRLYLPVRRMMKPAPKLPALMETENGNSLAPA